MKRAQYIKLIISIAIIIVGIWYFVLKDYNYKISFTSRQAPGIIYSNLLQWNHWEDYRKKVVTTTARIPFSEIRQEFQRSDTLYTYRWIIKRKNDSLTKITVLIKDPKNSFWQNLQAPFYKSDFVKRSIATVKKIGQDLIAHQSYYKVSPVQQAKIPSTYCAYIPLTSSLHNKAGKMMNTIHLAMNYIEKHNIALTGDPFLEITDWNFHEGKIRFNFCFPVKEQDDYPDTPELKFKRTKEKKALKTIFSGNYKISDRAWYTLINYAELHKIPVETLPVEIYLNDPRSGEDESQWKAEVYLPIKN